MQIPACSASLTSADGDSGCSIGIFITMLSVNSMMTHVADNAQRILKVCSFIVLTRDIINFIIKQKSLYMQYFNGYTCRFFFQFSHF